MPRPAAPEPPPCVPWRSVALPVEHGGWGFLVEPIVLGLAIAPSLSGLALALGAAAGFLVRHPLRLVLMDRRKGARYPRTALAERFVLGYAAAAAVLLAAGFALARQPFWPGLAAAAPFGLAALWFDAAGRSREAAPEALGAAALSASAVVIAFAGGAPAGRRGPPPCCSRSAPSRPCSTSARASASTAACRRALGGGRRSPGRPGRRHWARRGRLGAAPRRGRLRGSPRARRLGPLAPARGRAPASPRLAGAAVRPADAGPARSRLPARRVKLRYHRAMMK